MTRIVARKAQTGRWTAAAVLLCPMLAGACAHRDGGPEFAELGAPLPAPSEPSHGPFHRVVHWITPGGHSAATPRRLGLDSSIASICSNPSGRAVIDEDLPGLTSRPEYDFFKHMSLKTLKSMSGGKMTDEDLAKVATDLAKLDAEPSQRAMR